MEGGGWRYSTDYPKKCEGGGGGGIPLTIRKNVKVVVGIPLTIRKKCEGGIPPPPPPSIFF